MREGAEVHYIHGEKSEQESYFRLLSVLHAKYPDTKGAGVPLMHADHSGIKLVQTTQCFTSSALPSFH